MAAARTSWEALQGESSWNEPSQPWLVVPSTEQRKPRGCSLLLAVQVGARSGVGDVGACENTVSGASSSIVKRCTAGVGSVCPPTVARTANVWEPLRPSYDTGELHALNAAPSSEHW